MQSLKSCYEILNVDQNSDSFDIREAYMHRSKHANIYTNVELFNAYTLAMELCVYAPFFDHPCNDPETIFEERETIHQAVQQFHAESESDTRLSSS
jgi:hypothetical protein